MKEFYFNHPDFLKRSVPMKDLFQRIYGSSMDEETFVAMYALIPVKKHWSKKRGRSAAVHQYRKLKKVYKFFNGNK